jgi:glycosyltransferase involved in cell wall biosynthesis
MTQDEIAKVYGSCDITINASKKVEGFSLPPLESMASGTPVITSDCGGVMDYAVDGFNALVVHAENSQAIREKLDLLLKDEKLYDRLADQGIKTSKQYVWYNQIDKLEKLFYDLYFESLEQEYLQQCLESIKTIANEIIIVDTGSTDETIQIAKRFGVKLYHFEWNDDFSAARNFALSKATQKWTLILDADERIASKDLLKLREMLQGDNFAYNFETRNYVTDRNIEGVRACDGRYKEDKDFVGWCWSVKIRLFQTNKQIQFVGKVHELVEESINVPVKNAQIQILHFGYLKNRQNKDNLYLRLGIEKLKNKKDDVKAIFELATQYMALNDYDEALVLWRKALEIEPGNVDFLSKIGTTYNLLENYASAEKYFKKSLQIKETEYAYRHLGITYAKLNDYQKSYDCFRKIIHVTKDLKAFGDYAYCCNVLRKFDETILIVEPLMKKYRSIVQPWGLLDIAYNEKAIEFARTRKFQQALLFLRQAIALNPNFEAAQRNLKEVVRVMNLTGSTK